MDTVLCVDDEPGVLSALQRLFLEEPWDTLCASNGAEGLELVHEHQVDLVLADFRMPGMDGVELLKHVKELQPDCVRVVLSGYADIRAIVSALNEGRIYRFIAKPWNDEELLHTARELLEQLHDERKKQRAVEALAARFAEVERNASALGEIFARLPVPVAAVDSAGRVVLANAATRQQLGEDPCGRTLDECGVTLPEATPNGSASFGGVEGFVVALRTRSTG